MKKIFVVTMLSVALMLGLSMSTWAYNVTYAGGGLYTAASNSTGHAETDETYGATNLIPYGSSFAIVDQTSVPGTTLFFDKVVNFSAADVVTGHSATDHFQTTWKVENTGPFTWSDYHLLINLPTNGALTIFAVSDVTITGAHSAQLNDATFGDLFADFNLGLHGGSLISPGDTLNFSITFDPSGLYPLGGDISVRQIATTSPVPIPPSVLLMGSGLLGLGLVGWRRRQTKA